MHYLANRLESVCAALVCRVLVGIQRGSSLPGSGRSFEHTVTGQLGRKITGMPGCSYLALRRSPVHLALGDRAFLAPVADGCGIRNFVFLFAPDSRCRLSPEGSAIPKVASGARGDCHRSGAMACPGIRKGIATETMAGLYLGLSDPDGQCVGLRLSRYQGRQIDRDEDDSSFARSAPHKWPTHAFSRRPRFDERRPLLAPSDRIAHAGGADTWHCHFTSIIAMANPSGALKFARRRFVVPASRRGILKGQRLVGREAPPEPGAARHPWLRRSLGLSLLARCRLSLSDPHRMGNRAGNQPEAIDCALRFTWKGDDQGSVNNRGQGPRQNGVWCQF
jgi:hypothetical protein